MLSKNTIKLINSLNYKKYRNKEKLFIVEGDKNIEELLLQQNNIIKRIYVNHYFLGKNQQKLTDKSKIEEVNNADIKKISQLKTPQNSLAVCHIPPKRPIPQKLNHISIYLDDIQDPGNLGTILRICDWFNIEYLFCSISTVDIYNPKVIQASMGSYARVKTIYADFNEIQPITSLSKTTIISADMNGKSIYQYTIPKNCLLVMGNEGNGIKKEIINQSQEVISIPKFGKAESLNVGIATGIICSNYYKNN